MESRIEKLEMALLHYIEADKEHRSKFGAGILSQVKRLEYTNLLYEPDNSDEVIEIELGGGCEYHRPMNMDRNIEELR